MTVLTVTFSAEGKPSRAIDIPCDKLPYYFTDPFVINGKDNTVEDLLDWIRARVVSGAAQIKGDI